MKKKILIGSIIGIVLVVAIIIGAVFLLGNKEEKKKGELEFALNEDGESYSVVGLGNYSDTDVVIPDTYKGKPVTKIADKAFYGIDIVSVNGGISQGKLNDCAQITSIVIPDSVTSIGYEAFLGCRSLTNITIPNSVTYIGSSAFAYCASLTRIILPDSVTYIGSSAFQDCASLTRIILPDSITSIEQYAFSGCSSLATITLPDSITSIEQSAFSDCSSLTTIALPDSVTSIAGYTFSGCASLVSIAIPNTLTHIGDFAFWNCVSLKNIEIPNTVVSVASCAFIGCDSLQYSEYDNAIYLGNENNPYYLLVRGKDENITSCKVHDETKIIASQAFSDCVSYNVTIITPINSNNSNNDEEYVEHSHSHGSDANGENNTNNTLGNENMIYYAKACALMESITIPNSVENIGGGVFGGCISLANVYFGGTVAEWKSIAVNLGWTDIIISGIHTPTTPTSYIVYCTDGQIEKDGTVTYYQ